MPIQRESDNEEDDNDSIAEMVVIPKYQVSQQKLDHLARARQRKAELAQERAGQPTPKQEMRAQQREESLALSRGVKKIKDPVAKEVIKKEILKATSLKPKNPVGRPLSTSNISISNELKEPPAPAPTAPPAPIQKTRKQPQVVLEESEPEIVYVKVPRKRIVVQQSETESEIETPKPKARRTRKPRQPVETDDSESDYAPPTRPRKYNNVPQYVPPGFKINF